MEEAFKNFIRHLFKRCKPTKFVNDPNGGRRRLSKTHRPSPSFTTSRTAGCSPHSITHQELAPRSYHIALYGRHTYLCIRPDLLKCDYEKKTIQAIETTGFEISQDKIPFSSPWTYLGLWIQECTIIPQQLTIRDDPKTLRDLHQLCASTNWVHSVLGITTEDLAPLFNLLRGSQDLDSPRALAPETRESISKVQEALSSRQAHCHEPTLPFQLAILESQDQKQDARRRRRCKAPSQQQPNCPVTRYTTPTLPRAAQSQLTPLLTATRVPVHAGESLFWLGFLTGHARKALPPFYQLRDAPERPARTPRTERMGAFPK